MAVWKEIVKFAANKGKEAAIDKYGYKAVKGAQDSMKRSASRKKAAAAKKGKSKEPEVKKLDLASQFTPGKTLASLTEAERDAVNMLLKLTFGKGND